MQQLMKPAATLPAKRRPVKSTRASSPAPRDRGFLRAAHAHILGVIAGGEHPEGAALSELSLAAQLGLSRTPIREAIAQLVSEGVLQKSSRGAIVAQPTRQDVVDLYELREALEVHVIGKVTEQGLSVRDHEVLALLVDQVRSLASELKKSGRPVLTGEALNRLVDCDLRFHMTLLRAGGNQRILKLLDSTNLLLRIFTLRRAHHTVRLLEEVHRFHRRILEAVAAGSRENAQRLMGEHIRISRDERLTDLDEARDNQPW
jgi:DNA-binding GntR family transcriptional regulator